MKSRRGGNIIFVSVFEEIIKLTFAVSLLNQQAALFDGKIFK